MEAQRRLALLSSHLRPRSTNRFSSLVSTSNCVGVDVGDDDGCMQKHGSENEEDNCVFCKIIRGESPAFKIYEDDISLCILDLNPLNHGHSLIIPKRHFSSLKATPPSVIASMCSRVPCISNAIMKATKSDSFNLLVNSGEAAGQVIFHTHLHIIPRKACDRLWTSQSFKREPLKLDQKANQLADSIREQLCSKDEKG